MKKQADWPWTIGILAVAFILLMAVKSCLQKYGA